MSPARTPQRTLARALELHARAMGAAAVTPATRALFAADVVWQSDRTVRRWLAGETRIPPAVLARLARWIRQDARLRTRAQRAKLWGGR